MTKYFCGIDPGKEGAIAFISEDGSEYSVFDLTDAPYLTFLDASGHFEESISCGLEKMMPFSKSGFSAISQFNLGDHYGYLRGLLDCFKGNYTEITPQTWQKGIIPKGLDKKIKKRTHVEIAEKMFPKAVFRTPRGRILDGRADAMFLADYMRREHLNQQST